MNFEFYSNVTETEREEDPVAATVKRVKVEEEVKVKVQEPVKKNMWKEFKFTFTDTCIAAILLGSIILSLLEWYRAIMKEFFQAGGKEADKERRFSIVDLRINRHIRRLEKEEREAMMPDCYKLPKPRPLLQRRSSFPIVLPRGYNRHGPLRLESNPGCPSYYSRRTSIDMDEYVHPRRVRLIRRH